MADIAWLVLAALVMAHTAWHARLPGRRAPEDSSGPARAPGLPPARVRGETAGPEVTLRDDVADALSADHAAADQPGDDHYASRQ